MLDGWMLDVGCFEKAEIQPTQPSWSWSWAELVNIRKNTSLAAQGALAHRLQRRTMQNLGGS